MLPTHFGVCSPVPSAVDIKSKYSFFIGSLQIFGIFVEKLVGFVP